MNLELLRKLDKPDLATRGTVRYFLLFSLSDTVDQSYPEVSIN